MPKLRLTVLTLACIVAEVGCAVAATSVTTATSPTVSKLSAHPTIALAKRCKIRRYRRPW